MTTAISHQTRSGFKDLEHAPEIALPRFGIVLSWFVFLFLAGLFTHVFGGDEEAGVAAGLFTPLTFAIYSASALVLMSRSYRTRLHYYLSHNWLHWLALAVIALSALWSLSPEVTVRRSIALFGTTASGLLVGITFTELGMVKQLRKGFLILVLVSVVLALFFPQFGTHPSGKFQGVWRGILTFKNQFGWMIAVFLILWMSQLRSKGRYFLFWVFLATGLVCLFQSASATGLVVTTFGISFLTIATLYYRAGYYRVPMVLIAVCLIAIVVPVANDVLDTSLEIVGKDATLTGRTSIWSTLWIFIEPNIWLGNGYSAFWSDPARYLGPSSWMVTINHSHNAYIEVMLDNGILGLVTALLFILNLLFSLHKLASKRDGDAATLLTIVSATMIIGLAGALLFRPNVMAWMLFILASAYVSEMRRKAKIQASI